MNENDSFSNLGRCISILDRLMQMYYNHGLSDYEIGWGQQFYVEYIYHHPGATAQEMVDYFCVDKATLTKIIKKLVEIEYIKLVGDEKDKRMKHLYLTQKAVPAVTRIKEIHSGFYKTLSQNISPLELRLTEENMNQMIENINKKIWHRMESGKGNCGNE